MGNELNVPDYLKGQRTGSSDTASAISASMSVPRLSLRGKVFRYIENGEEIKKQQLETTVVILGVEPEPGRMIKTYYEKGYTPGNTDPPDCASHDGIAPSPWVNKKQSDFCNICKWNQFGSATSPTGKPTKKCRDAKQLWLLRTDDPQGFEGVQYGLNVSVSSLKAFSDYGRKLEANGVGFPDVVTKLTFVDSEFPQLNFEVDSFVPKESIPITRQLNAARPWKMLTSLSLAAPSDSGSHSAVQLPGMTTAPVVMTSPGSPPPADDGKSVDDVLNKW